MKRNKLLLATALASLVTNVFSEDGARNTGKFLFDKETFGGNGRSCSTCHSKETGTFSIEEVEARFAANPNDPLFRVPDSDNLDGASYTRLRASGTIRIDVPLAPNVRVVGDPSARTVAIFRGTPTVKNVTTLQQFLMSDGRESSGDLQHQAVSAIHQHTQNTVEPRPAQLDKIAEFERTGERFFSSDALERFANGGKAPKLPAGRTASEKRGKEFLNENRQCGICHSGPMLDTSSQFDFLLSPGSRFHFSGAGFELGPLAESFDAEGNLLLDEKNPNVNRIFEFTLPDGSKQLVVGPDPGRGLVTGDVNDAFNIKIATLWGIKDTAPYFHDNSSRTLRELLDHYNRLFQFINDQFPPPEVLPLMSEQDKTDLIAYLNLL